MSRRPIHIRGENLCRRCINEKYDLNLKPSDCRYWFYRASCSKCENVGNIVMELSPSGHSKAFFHSLFRKKKT